MTGVLLAGGTGSRLLPLTKVANKHLLPVYDQPMIYYPIQTLKTMGCTRIILVSGGNHIGGFAELLGDGSDLDIELVYRVQPYASGVAQALSYAEGLVDGVFPVILGDNYFSEAPSMPQKPCLYTKEVADAFRFGVYHEGQIVEKPTAPESAAAVTGLYIYDERVFDHIRTLVPSARGELEITDINNWYLQQGCNVEAYEGYWSDMGTFDSLLQVANFLQEHQL